MKIGGISRETMLEIGLVGFLLSLIVGAVMLLGGRIAGGATRSSKKSAPPPGAGEVDSGRHRNIANSPAR